MLKILIVSPKFHPIIGGGETFVLNSITQLHEAGVDVSIAVEPNTERHLSDYPYPVYEIPGLSDSHLDVITAPDGLYKLIQKIKPDVIHAHGYFALLALYLCDATKLPVVASIHSTPVWGQRIVGGMSGFDQERIFAENIIASSKPSVFTAANDVYAKAAEKIASGNVPVELFPYPILTAFFEKHDRSVYRKLFDLKDNQTLLTVPSRIIERKGIMEAVKAFAQLPDTFYLCLPSAAAPLDAVFWQTIVSSEAYGKVSNRIIIPTEPVLHEQMPLLYAASDLIVMPSYYEGAPVATVETMASGKPFIGADSQGINGFIRNGENGLLVPPKAVNKLVEAIVQLTNDTALQQKLTTQAAKDVAHLSWKVQLPKLIELYERYSI